MCIKTNHLAISILEWENSNSSKGIEEKRSLLRIIFETMNVNRAIPTASKKS